MKTCGNPKYYGGVVFFVILLSLSVLMTVKLSAHLVSIEGGGHGCDDFDGCGCDGNGGTSGCMVPISSPLTRRNDQMYV